MSVDSVRAPRRRLRIALYGWQPFYRRPVRAAVLAALDRLGPLAPDHSSLADSGARPLDREALVTSRLGPGPVVLEIARVAAPSWSAFMSLGDRAWLGVDVPPKTLEATGPRVWFELGDALIAALEPDLAFLHLASDAPRASLDPRRRRLDEGVPAGEDFYDRGPRSLAMRTSLGPRPLRHLAEPLLRELETIAVVRRDGDARVTIDLAPDPWAAGEDAFLERSERALELLAPSALCAKGKARVDLGGVARESATGLRLDPDERASGDIEPDPRALLDAARDKKPALDVVLSWADLRGANLVELVADQLDLSWARLEDALLQRARIAGGSFDSANLERAQLDGATLTESSLDDAIAPQLSLRACAIEDTTFRNTVLTGADLSHTRIRSATFDAAMLGGVRFDGAHLSECSFAGADCTKASFVGAILERVDFTGADLRGADLSVARTDDASFEGAIRGPYEEPSP